MRWCLRFPVLFGMSAVLLNSWLIWESARVRGQNKPAESGPYTTEKFAGASACMRCHTLKASDDVEDFAVLTEYTTWRIHDKHSLAYAALEGPRGQKILQVLRNTPNKPIDAISETACLNCHGLHFPGRLSDPDALKDGVSCETCHGPSALWLGPHSSEKEKWRRRTPGEKYRQFGMYDIRDPIRRAQLCLSCHIGNAAQGKVVTHAMFAAGHPPLRSMEVALFSENMPRHWRLTKDVPYLQRLSANRDANADTLKAYHWDSAAYQQSQLVLATSLAGLQASLQLIVDRADSAAFAAIVRWPELTEPTTTSIEENWPELALAHSDCYACHHELQRPSWRQRRGYFGKPGRVQVRSWPLTLAQWGVHRDNTASLPPLLKQLALACAERPFGEPRQVARAARAAADWPSDLAGVVNYRPDRKAWIRNLCAVSENEFQDFESARQIVAGLQIISAESAAKQSPAVVRAFDQLRDELNLNSLDWARKERIRLLTRLLAQLADAEELLKDERFHHAIDWITGHGFDEAFAVKSPERQNARKAVNQLLTALRDHGGKKLTAGFFENQGAFLKELQAINNREWEAMATKMSKYDPQRFRASLQNLATLLSEN